jgi:hypothetical protein
MTDNVRYLRQSIRVLGPFDGVRPGVFDMPVQIYDLSIGGCFVNSVHDPPEPGQIFTINIDLPSGETIVTHCETASVRPGFGYGVKFCQMSDDSRIQLERAIDALKHWKATLE